MGTVAGNAAYGPVKRMVTARAANLDRLAGERDLGLKGLIAKERSAHSFAVDRRTLAKWAAEFSNYCWPLAVSLAWVNGDRAQGSD